MKAKIAKIVCLVMVFALCLAPVTSTAKKSKIKISKKKITLYVGKTKTLKVKGTKKKVKWKSSKKSVATVSKKGKVKAKKKGTAKITAKVGKKKLTCKVTVKKKVASSAITSIKSVSDKVFGKTGTCVSLAQLQNATTLKYVKKHYSSITLENEMKPDAVLNADTISKTAAQAKTSDYVIPSNYTESTVPTLNFAKIDAVLKIAKANGLKLRAHTLVWHSQTPEWFFKKGYSTVGSYVSADVMDARMEMYIRSVMHHVYSIDNGAYKDVVYAWDVANEYLHNFPGRNWSAVYGARASKLKNNPPYLKKAFEIAYSVLEEMSITDKVALYYNDYNTYVEADNIVELINYINKDEKAKICTGVGMQSHLDVDYPTAAGYVAAARKFAAAGFKIQITEFDVTIDNNQGAYRNEGQTSADQSTYIAGLMKELAAFQKETKAIDSFTLWGLYDDVSWRGGAQSMGNSHPLLFDENMNDPKPSYYAFIKALRS